MLSRVARLVGRHPFIAVLALPGPTFRSIAVAGRGFGALLCMLAVELVLTLPLDVAGAAMRFAAQPGAAVSMLWSQYLGCALGPAGIVFAGGVVLRQALRRRPAWRIELWSAVSVLSYTWVPHVLLTSAGVALAAVGLDVPLLPHHQLNAAGASLPLALGRLVVALGPSIALGVVAVRALTAGLPARAPFATQRRTAATATLALGLLLLGALGAGAHVARDWRLARPVFAGDRLAPFRLKDLQGGILDSTALAGRVVLVDVWASWCPACLEAMPALVELYRELGGAPFTLVSVNVEADNLEAVRAFVAKSGLPFPVYIDSGALQAGLRVQSLPSSFLIDQTGIVRRADIGPRTIEELREEVRGLLPPAP